MNRVVDASVACKWFFEEALSVEAQALAATRYVFLAPDLIIAECANVAWRRVRDGQISLDQAEAFLRALPAWFESLTPSVQLHEAAFHIAHTLNHPVYDCLYIALAVRDAAPLVTADVTLARRVRNTPWEKLVELLGGRPQAQALPSSSGA